MTSRLPKTAGIYLITPQMDDTEGLCSVIGSLLRQPPALLQYRYKGKDPALKRQQARALLLLCRDAGVPLVINDDWSLARDVGADGVHLGASDADPAMVRAELGAEALIGVSCYGDFERAKRLSGHDVDYLAFGAVFASPTKPMADRAPLDLFRKAGTLGKPTVAIGGITPDNSRQLRDAGADFIAVISGVFDAPDPAQALAAYHQAFSKDSA
jgi:thiamine-phosphate pyrophosphorylase